MNTTYLTMARRLFDRPDVPRTVVRHNMRSWVASLRYLGPNWLALRPVQRIQ